MTGTEIATRQATDTWVDVVPDVANLSDYIARTDFVPKAMRGNAPAVAATILTGRELGIGPMTALRSLDVIEGSVQMKAKAILARIFAAGHRVEWVEASDRACEVKITRADGLTSASVRWTIADAQRADLAGKAVWRRYPRAMLRSRALSECAELVCPDVILGLEVGDPEVTQVAAASPSVMQAPAWASATVDPPAAESQVADAPAPAAAVPPAAPPVTVADLDSEPISSAQQRLMGALIGQWETAQDRKLDRTERRRLIGFMAGMPDPDVLGSAKDLTKGQASRAIDALQQAIAAAEAEPPPEPAEDDVIDGEVVEDPPE